LGTSRGLYYPARKTKKSHKKEDSSYPKQGHKRNVGAQPIKGTTSGKVRSSMDAEKKDTVN